MEEVVVTIGGRSVHAIVTSQKLQISFSRTRVLLDSRDVPVDPFLIGPYRRYTILPTGYL